MININQDGRHKGLAVFCLYILLWMVLSLLYVRGRCALLLG